MMRGLAITLLCGLAACTVGCPPPEMPASRSEVATAPRPAPGPRASTLPLPPVPPGERFDPRALIVAADLAHADAAGYVGWAGSTPENIIALTTLTRALELAILRMQSHAQGTTYPAQDVADVRQALAALRQFLTDKQD